jgi:hypothetical protein
MSNCRAVTELKLLFAKKEQTMLSGKRLEMTADMLPKQHGWECQVTALSGVLNWLYQSGFIIEKPIVFRKRFDPDATTSLRKIAKERFRSTVGELNSVYDIVKLAKIHPEVTASYITCTNLDDYVSAIINAVDHNLAPIIFFEGSGSGQPVIDRHNNDHAAVVIGYHFDEVGFLKFTIAQWRREYEVTAEDLFDSTNQTRTTGYTLFEKVHELGERPEKAAWIPEEYLSSYYRKPVALKVREATHDILKGLYKNSIVIVNTIHMVNQAIESVNQKIADLKDDKSESAKSNRNSLNKLKSMLKNNDQRETVFKIMENWKAAPSGVEQKTNEELMEKSNIRLGF